MSKSGQSSGFIGANKGGVIGGSPLSDISDATNLTASLPIVLTDDDISLRNSEITTLGTLTTLTVDNISIDGTTIGHTSDTDLLTLADGELTLNGNMVIQDDGWIGQSAAGDRIVFDTNGNHIQFNSEKVDFVLGTMRAEFNTNGLKIGDYTNADTTDGVQLEFGSPNAHIICSDTDGILTFDTECHFTQNLTVTEDVEISIGGDTEKIVFNGGSARIDLRAGQTFIGSGGGNGYLGSYGDNDTYLRYQANQITLRAGGVDHIDITSSGVTLGHGSLIFDGHYANITCADTDAMLTIACDTHLTGNLILSDDGFIGCGTGDERIVFDSDGNDITLRTENVFIQRKLIHNGDGDTFLDFGVNTLKIEVGGTVIQDISATATNFGDTDVVRPNLKDYSETVNAIGTITGDTAVNFASGNVQTVTGNGDCLFTFTNPPASGKAGTLTLIITNGGANTTTWHSSVKWPGDNAPALTASGVDVISFMTIDAGTTVYGFVGGINFS